MVFSFIVFNVAALVVFAGLFAGLVFLILAGVYVLKRFLVSEAAEEVNFPLGKVDLLYFEDEKVVEPVEFEVLELEQVVQSYD